MFLKSIAIKYSMRITIANCIMFGLLAYVINIENYNEDRIKAAKAAGNISIVREFNMSAGNQSKTVDGVKFIHENGFYRQWLSAFIFGGFVLFHTVVDAISSVLHAASECKKRGNFVLLVILGSPASDILFLPMLQIFSFGLWVVEFYHNPLNNAEEYQRRPVFVNALGLSSLNFVAFLIYLPFTIMNKLEMNIMQFITQKTTTDIEISVFRLWYNTVAFALTCMATGILMSTRNIESCILTHVFHHHNGTNSTGTINYTEFPCVQRFKVDFKIYGCMLSMAGLIIIVHIANSASMLKKLGRRVLQVPSNSLLEFVHILYSPIVLIIAFASSIALFHQYNTFFSAKRDLDQYRADISRLSNSPYRYIACIFVNILNIDLILNTYALIISRPQAPEPRASVPLPSTSPSRI